MRSRSIRSIRRSASPENRPADPLARYFSGEALYGDDFTPDEIARWYADEEEAFAEMVGGDPGAFEYDALLQIHGLDLLGKKHFDHVLGIGSGRGYELLPFVGRTGHFTIIESSSQYEPLEELGDVECLKADPLGLIDLPESSVDLAVALAVLHHIPNVSLVLTELGRVVKDGGFLVAREPIISMGDWRHERPGLTRRERGIPLRIFLEQIDRAGFDIQRIRLIDFPVVGHLAQSPFTSRLWTRVDYLASTAFRWNYRYHGRRLRPRCAFVVAKRRDRGVEPRNQGCE